MTVLQLFASVNLNLTSLADRTFDPQWFHHLVSLAFRISDLADYPEKRPLKQVSYSCLSCILTLSDFLLQVAGQVGTKPKVKVGKGRQEGGGQADAEEKQAVLEDVAAIMSAPTLPKAPRTKKRKTDSMPPPHPPPVSPSPIYPSPPPTPYQSRHRLQLGCVPLSPKSCNALTATNCWPWLQGVRNARLICFIPNTGSALNSEMLNGPKRHMGSNTLSKVDLLINLHGKIICILHGN